MKLIIITLLCTLALGALSSCKKCYICRDRALHSVYGVGYKTKERIRICSDKIKNNDEMVVVRDYYESMGYDCELLTSGI